VAPVLECPPWQGHEWSRREKIRRAACAHRRVAAHGRGECPQRPVHKNGERAQRPVRQSRRALHLPQHGAKSIHRARAQRLSGRPPRLYHDDMLGHRGALMLLHALLVRRGAFWRCQRRPACCVGPWAMAAMRARGWHISCTFQCANVYVVSVTSVHTSVRVSAPCWPPPGQQVDGSTSGLDGRRDTGGA
jgi:hypothetical protein